MTKSPPQLISIPGYSARTYRVFVHSIGANFAHAATVKIGDETFRSRDVPFGMQQNAVTDLLARVRESYPKAELT